MRTYDIIETPSNVYIVMDFIEGNSLFNHLQDLDENDIWRYFRNLISAIEYCKFSFFYCLIIHTNLINL